MTIGNNKANQMAVTRLVDELGGPTKVAKALKVGASAVSNWQRLGRLPANTYWKMTEALRRQGAELPPPSLWGMKPHK